MRKLENGSLREEPIPLFSLLTTPLGVGGGKKGEKKKKEGIRSETFRAQNACSSFETQGVTAKLF